VDPWLLAIAPIALCALPLIELAWSLQDTWFTHKAFLVHNAVLDWLMWGSFAAGAVLALSSRARRRTEEALEGLGDIGTTTHLIWLTACFAGVFGELLFIKYCQYRGFQLPQDTAATANIAYNFLHHGTLESSIFGLPSYLAVHFMPVIALFSPLLLLWNSAFMLILVQTACLASMPFAVYLLVYRSARSPSAAFIGLWLSLSSPFFTYLSGASLAAQVCLAAFFLWGILAAEARRWLLAAVFFLLMLLSVEQAPFTFFGLGLYLAFRSGLRDRKAWLFGAGVCLASALLFLVEMKVIRSHPESAEFLYWDNFKNLGDSAQAVVTLALRAPWELAARVVWPLTNLEPLWRMLYSTGFFCVLASWQTLPWILTALPNLMADPASAYHQVLLHYPAYLIGPLWWAMAAGICASFGFARRKGWSALLLAWAFLIGGFNLRGAARALAPNSMRSYFESGPRMAARIPEDASLWASEYMTAWLAGRSHIKSLTRADDPAFRRRLFVPDYILFDKIWILQADPALRSSVAAFLKNERYLKVVEDAGTVLMKHPRAPLRDENGRPPPMALPPPRPGVDFNVQWKK